MTKLRQQFPRSSSVGVHPLVEHAEILKTVPALKKYKNVTYPPQVMATISKEIARFMTLESTNTEFASTIQYIDFLFALPWDKQQSRPVNLVKAEKTLDRTHFGMPKIKEKAIEFIATLNNGGNSGGALCLVGPPGVGKTSVAQSFAAAMGRESIVISMGGVHDPALIRGHARTYSGSLPGKIIQAVLKAGVSNPVIILDEVEKTAASDKGGRVADALLELIDPSQNKAFTDHYINLPFDLSHVVFIMTANDTDTMHPALRDRLEMIELRGYTDEEKFHIAQSYLVPKNLSGCGLTTRQLKFKDDALHGLIENYTQEAGVRGLEKEIKSICRKQNVIFQKGIAKSATITAKALPDLIGPPRIFRTKVHDRNAIGQTNGLYFTDIGGGVLPIQVAIRPSDKFNLAVTGLPGNMIKESASYVVEMLKSRAERYGLTAAQFDKSSFHIHLPDAATPKDGPSAGVAIATALMSALKNTPALHFVAMTGEVDLFGKVLPIGGVIEKLEGARKAGASNVIIPWDNQRDLYDAPKNLLAQLEIKPVRNIEEAFEYALGILPNRATVASNDSENVVSFISQAAAGPK